MPWIQFGFWCPYVIMLLVLLGFIDILNTDMETEEGAMEVTWVFFAFGAVAAIINIIMSCLMIKIVVRDRSNLSEIFEPFEPFDRYTGCYDVPYAYLDEDDLTTWPGVSRRMMFYFFFSLIVQPFLIFCYTITYR